MPVQETAVGRALVERGNCGGKDLDEGRAGRGCQGAKGTKFLELVDQQQQVAAAYDRLPAP